MQQPPKFDRSTAGLRDALFSEMEDLKSGVSTAADAYAFATLADKVIQSLHVDLKIEALRERAERQRQLLIAPPDEDGAEDEARE